MINAVGLTGRFLSELKQLVPDLQKHLNGSIEDISTALHNIVNSITDEVISGGNIGGEIAELSSLCLTKYTHLSTTYSLNC